MSQQGSGELVRIGALWQGREGSKAVLTGKMGDARLLIFQNTRKESENQPDYIVCVAQQQRRDDGGQQARPNPGGVANSGGFGSGTRPPPRKPVEPAPEGTFADDEIPF